MEEGSHFPILVNLVNSPMDPKQRQRTKKRKKHLHCTKMKETHALLFDTELTFEQRLAVARLESDGRIALARDERAFNILNDQNSTIAALAEARNVLREKETLMAALVEWLG